MDKDKAIIWLIVLLAVVVLFNQYQLSYSFSSPGSSSSNVPLTSSADVMPKGVPAVYGQELGISYDGVSVNNPQLADATLGKMGAFDTSITLTGDKLQRYINIGLQISCEYCCGAESVIFKNGEAACGCAHSQAMRGVAKYLIDRHNDEFTDDQILEEMGKWKVLSFPGIHQQKAAVLAQKGIELNYINLASNKYRGIEKGAPASSGAMVGGC